MARKARKAKAMARTARKEAQVKTRVRIPIPTLELFVGFVEERPLEHGMLVEPKEPVWLWRRPTKYRLRRKRNNGTGKGAGYLERGDRAAAVDSSRHQLSRALWIWHRQKSGRSSHLVEMDTRHGCGDFGSSAGCKDWRRNGCYKTDSGKLIPDHGGLCVNN